MSNGYIVPISPTELASRLVYEEDYDNLELSPEELEALNVSVDTFASYFAEGTFESQISPLLDRIPEREADFIEMYYLKNKIQADIADIFGVTQAAVSYRLVRGLERLKFLLDTPQINEEDLRRDLQEIFPTKLGCHSCEKSGKTDCPICHGTKVILLDVEILIGMLRITCQSKVAEMLGLTQGRVRHRFFSAVEILGNLAKEQPKYEPYHKVFGRMAQKNFNVLHEVRLPQWADRGKDECR